MRIACFLQGGAPAWAVRRGEMLHPIEGAEGRSVEALLALLAEGVTPREGEARPASGVTLLAPVPRPGKVVCLGLNYADHAKEGGNPIPDYPAVFLRATTSLVGPGEAILRPSCSDKLDYEAELAVIIGLSATRVAEAEALAHVAAYSCFNDGSVRDYQRKSTQWTMGKNFDATGGFGPDMVTADALPPGAHGLAVRARLNGRLMQDGNTADMIFSVARTIAILSEGMTLEPGDVVITGTPAGVGYAREPAVFMRAGDVCEVEIEGVGLLRNTVADAA